MSGLSGIASPQSHASFPCRRSCPMVPHLHFPWSRLGHTRLKPSWSRSQGVNKVRNRKTRTYREPSARSLGGGGPLLGYSTSRPRNSVNDLGGRTAEETQNRGNEARKSLKKKDSVFCNVQNSHIALARLRPRVRKHKIVGTKLGIY
jgi:hypothetical protein